ncbi:MAG: hypothetical protein RR732_04170 [Bacilli bacterium]
MALIDSSIAAVEDMLCNIEKGKEAIQTSSITFKFVMQNQDFVTFAGGTSIGKELNVKLEKLLTVIDGKLSEEILELCADTRNFLDYQRAENNKAI